MDDVADRTIARPEPMPLGRVRLDWSRLNEREFERREQELREHARSIE